MAGVEKEQRKKMGKGLLILNPSIDELLIVMNSNYYKIENKEDR